MALVEGKDRPEETVRLELIFAGMLTAADQGWRTRSRSPERAFG